MTQITTICFLMLAAVYYTKLVVLNENRRFDNKRKLILAIIPFYLWLKHVHRLYKELPK